MIKQKEAQTFEKVELPALYYAANAASLKSQRAYLRMFLSVLTLTVAAPAVIILSTACPRLAQPSRFVAAMLLVISVVLTGRIKETQKERTWYGGRAVAESVKTTAWRYAMGADPFPASSIPAEADAAFRNRLVEILKDRKSLNYSVAGDTNAKAQITEHMRFARSQIWEQRKLIYLKDRIQDQRKWYSNKATTSEGREGLYFWIILGVQIISIATASAFAAWPTLHLNATAVLTSTTAGLLAWLQVKRYQETSQSYALAAHELGIIEIGAENLKSEEDFAKFVADAENAMSREHTLWVARRDSK
jgi:SMODS and SLOG-associating 2TM effector domain 3/SMODS and SLOG-associating 2TM effector domain 1